MNFIILDLEATCWREEPYRKDMETIEIGALKVNQNGEVLGIFSEFIRPTINPVLSDFCKELTHITQEQVDGAADGHNIIQNFRDWCREEGEYVLCSWGWYDKKQLQMDCKLHKIDPSWLKNHISIKHQYMDMKGLKKCGLGTALELEGMEFEGTPHRGIDDAKNITGIFLKYFGEWKF